jgi:hypothetical protein
VTTGAPHPWRRTAYDQQAGWEPRGSKGKGNKGVDFSPRDETSGEGTGDGETVGGRSRAVVGG